MHHYHRVMPRLKLLERPFAIIALGLDHPSVDDRCAESLGYLLYFKVSQLATSALPGNDIP